MLNELIYALQASGKNSSLFVFLKTISTINKIRFSLVASFVRDICFNL